MNKIDLKFGEREGDESIKKLPKGFKETNIDQPQTILSLADVEQHLREEMIKTLKEL